MLALAALLFGLTLAGQRGGTHLAVAPLAVALVAGSAYVRHARRAAAPLIDLGLLAQPLLRMGIVIYLCVPGVFRGEPIAALYLQGAPD